MRELNLKLTGYNANRALVKVDGKIVAVKKNKFGNYSCKTKTENDKVRIEVFKAVDMGGIGWFITQLLFFIISVFGILDVKHREDCYVIDFAIDVDLKEENDITLRFNLPEQDGKVIDIETDLSYTEGNNKYLFDETAKKKIKRLKISKFIITLAMIATIIAVLIVKF